MPQTAITTGIQNYQKSTQISTHVNHNDIATQAQQFIIWPHRLKTLNNIATQAHNFIMLPHKHNRKNDITTQAQKFTISPHRHKRENDLATQAQQIIISPHRHNGEMHRHSSEQFKITMQVSVKRKGFQTKFSCRGVVVISGTKDKRDRVTADSQRVLQIGAQR